MARKTPVRSIKSNKPLLISFSIILVTFLSVVAFIFHITVGWGLVERMKMSGYLSNKYGKEFLVDNVHIEGAGIGVKGMVCANTAPLDNEKLTSRLCRSQTTERYEIDTYLQNLWTSEETDAIRDIVERDVPDLDSFRLTIRVSTADQIYKSIKGSTPSLKEVSKKSNGFGYLLNVTSTRKSLVAEPSRGKLEEAYKLVSLIKSRNSVDPELNYVYRDNDYVPSKERPYQYTISIKRSDLPLINSPKDLGNYFSIIK